MGKYVELNNSNFEATIAEGVTMVDFWAPWCGPCRMMAPAFEEASTNFPLKAQFAKVNTEEYGELSAQFGIRGIPTIIIFKNGQEVDRVSGALSAGQIVQLVSQYR